MLTDDTRSKIENITGPAETEVDKDLQPVVITSSRHSSKPIVVCCIFVRVLEIIFVLFDRLKIEVALDVLHFL